MLQKIFYGKVSNIHKIECTFVMLVELQEDALTDFWEQRYVVSNQVGEQNKDWKKLIVSCTSLFRRLQLSLLCCQTYSS